MDQTDDSKTFEHFTLATFYLLIIGDLSTKLPIVNKFNRKMFSSSMIIGKFRYIFADYNISCDSNGRLTL
ncbi:unnamed protein product [Rotaria sordida]|uniref:Uncharacterized protein n=1 Tax=Rotaria sordida TaxID=392033 RepID=A0A814ZR92_9BILA|nr:unnamed protein product [Rotaria sordida]CAF1527742.1 unnamed protein product [Rotaria sordida]